MGYNKLKQKVATALLIVMSTSATLSVAAATTSVQAKISSSATLRAASPSNGTSSDAEKPDDEANAVNVSPDNITTEYKLGTVRVEGLEEGQELTIANVPADQRKDESDLKSLSILSGYRFTGKFFGIEIKVSDHKGADVTIFLDAPEELEIENDNDKVIGIHFDNGTPKEVPVKIIKNGNKFRMKFSSNSFSPFYFVKVETITASGSNSPSGGGSSSSGGGRSSSATREATMNGNWVAENGVWKFLKDNGEYATNTWGYIKGQWYFFDAQGNMVTGWYLVNDQWYYMNPAEGSLQGVMLTGWVMDSNFGGWFYLNATGAMVTGWNEINGKWYYLNPISNGTKGIMAANTYVDNYYVGADGAWIQ